MHRGEGESAVYEGNLETWRLVEQIESLRGAIRFLRSENSYLKSQDMLGTLEDLPTYTVASAPPPSTPSQLAGIPARSLREISTDPTARRREFASESRQLLLEARLLSATPKVVDLSLPQRGRWQPGSRAPQHQLRAEKERVQDLARRVDKLWQMRPQLVF